MKLTRTAAMLAAPLLLSATVAAGVAAASSPTLALVNVPHGAIGGEMLPYAEVNSQVELSAGYSGHLPAGSRAALLVRAPAGRSFKVTAAKVPLSGGHAKLHVSQGGIGGPYKYELGIVAHGHVTAHSRPVTLYWARPPDGVFALDSGESAFTSSTNASESCIVVGRCKGDAGSGETVFAEVKAGSGPVPPGWSATLIFNGTQVCTTKDIGGECGGQITFPQVTAATEIPLTGEIISPTGAVTSATLLVTDYP